MARRDINCGDLSSLESHSAYWTLRFSRHLHHPSISVQVPCADAIGFSVERGVDVDDEGAGAMCKIREKNGNIKIIR